MPHGAGLRAEMGLCCQEDGDGDLPAGNVRSWAGASQEVRFLVKNPPKAGLGAPGGPGKEQIPPNLGKAL